MVCGTIESCGLEAPDRSASSPSQSPASGLPPPVLHCYAGNLCGGIEAFLTTLAQQPPPPPAPQWGRFALCYEGRLSRQLQAAGAAVDWLGPARFGRPWTVLGGRRGV